MILQRAPASAKLWGWATPGIEVSVQFNNNVCEKEENKKYSLINHMVAIQQ
jgi:hypothetical protein